MSFLTDLGLFCILFTKVFCCFQRENASSILETLPPTPPLLLMLFNACYEYATHFNASVTFKLYNV